MDETLVTTPGAVMLMLQEIRTGDPLLARSRREVPGPPLLIEAVKEKLVSGHLQCSQLGAAHEYRLEN